MAATIALYWSDNVMLMDEDAESTLYIGVFPEGVYTPDDATEMLVTPRYNDSIKDVLVNANMYHTGDWAVMNVTLPVYSIFCFAHLTFDMHGKLRYAHTYHEDGFSKRKLELELKVASALGVPDGWMDTAREAVRSALSSLPIGKRLSTADIFNALLPVKVALKLI
jgi:hypothetical protein